jgi:hypothetical protein
MNNPELVSFAAGQYTPDVKYIASLSDGTTVLQDERPSDIASWSRLGLYLSANPGLKITGLKLVCGTTEFVMPANQAGYFFGNKAMAVFPSGGQAQFRGVGYYDGSKVTITWGSMPDLRFSRAEERDKEKAGFFLIENPE